jgi:Fe-S-cluster-containing hydrogenase component 2
MFWDFSARKAIKCDLCDGDPYCVKYCPREAILYAPESAQVVELRREYLANVPKLLGLISGGD